MGLVWQKILVGAKGKGAGLPAPQNSTDKNSVIETLAHSGKPDLCSQSPKLHRENSSV